MGFAMSDVMMICGYPLDLIERQVEKERGEMGCSVGTTEPASVMGYRADLDPDRMTEAKPEPSEVLRTLIDARLRNEAADLSKLSSVTRDLLLAEALWHGECVCDDEIESLTDAYYRHGTASEQFMRRMQDCIIEAISGRISARRPRSASSVAK